MLVFLSLLQPRPYVDGCLVLVSPGRGGAIIPPHHGGVFVLKGRTLSIVLFCWDVRGTSLPKSTLTDCVKLVMVVIRICFDLSVYVHGNQLELYRDELLLKHTVPGKVSRWQLTSIKCPLFWSVCDKFHSPLKLAEGQKNPQKKGARVYLHLVAYKGDFQPSYRAWCLDSKNVGGEGVIDETHTSSYIMFKNVQNSTPISFCIYIFMFGQPW